MSFLRAFLVRVHTYGFEDPDWHERYSTAQLWRWYEQLQERR
jgi:hypothetical protein